MDHFTKWPLSSSISILFYATTQANKPGCGVVGTIGRIDGQNSLSCKHNTPTPWNKNEVVTLLNDHFMMDFELIKPQDPVA